jgi:hypothetical protein
MSTNEAKENVMAARKRTPPGDAEKPEGTPAARDGSPDEDELARRRAEKANGTSVADRVQNGDDDLPEMFPVGSVEGDSKVTWKNMIKPGKPVTLTASLSSAQVPLTGGLLDPEREVTLVVRGLPGMPVPVAKHRDAQAGGDHTVEEITMRQPIRAMHVENAGELVNRVQLVEVLDAEGVPSATVTKVLAGLFGEEPEAAHA